MSSAATPSCSPKHYGVIWALASRCASSMPTTKSTRPSAPSPTFNACTRWLKPTFWRGACRAVQLGATTRFCTAPIIWRACLSNHCAKQIFLTKSRVGKAFLNAPRSKTCALGCACCRIKTTIRLSFAPSPRPNAAWATPVWRTWVIWRPATNCLCLRRCFLPAWSLR